MNLLVVHGPNLNLLGEREPEIYGDLTLAKVNTRIRKFCADREIRVRIFQSNGEGAIIDYLHRNRKWADSLVINPGAYTHYSYAIRDAIAAISLPTVEAHLSDIHKREKFRRKSVIGPVCHAQVSGLGWKSYLRAIEILLSRLSPHSPTELPEAYSH
ncbi:MAG TPA: type II 3-dehydroquinate dehydratase [Bdellovibrionales bacterium]|nr:MAG: type II 3-dehydroquinate dehydratase [Bdellovibrionales bacterium GWB1_52_6]OFZ04745.1 MAG: type II 3-dehydroquinate dehydratase [Bdellovibrionales bacterium GWA1_52_35]OFZ35655.1 MAG: type II 3-dehydroquinate dehydratase [Bdellovibrionales bacterium GWC1_52_8]HAR42022.1 type II 3-dehydroquinate dehydratase [Bdellovibrionales bacterium]HCM39558.1 type II 3-dehydroquinate dehydratase [Bdellovibrionales bacterium]